MFTPILLAATILTVPITVPEISAVPYKVTASQGPVIEAKAALVMDLGSGQILYAKNILASLPVASLTKLMTALIARTTYDLDDYLVAPPGIMSTPGSRLELTSGEELTVRSLLQALLIRSANDAAVTLAENYAGGSARFVEAMNARGKAIGLLSTHFTNPIGLDDKQLYSSVYDLATLMRIVRNDSFLAEVMQTRQTAITSSLGKTYNLLSTNQLFGSFIKVLGGKTGTTEEAGQCIINVTSNRAGNTILTIVLNSPDRFQESKILTYWTWKNYEWR